MSKSELDSDESIILTSSSSRGVPVDRRGLAAGFGDSLDRKIMHAQACCTSPSDALFRPSIGGDHIPDSLVEPACDVGAEVMAVHRT